MAIIEFVHANKKMDKKKPKARVIDQLNYKVYIFLT